MLNNEKFNRILAFAQENGYKGLEEIYQLIIDEKADFVGYSEGKQYYFEDYVNYLFKALENSSDTDRTYILSARKFSDELISLSGPRDSHPFFETAVRAFSRDVIKLEDKYEFPDKELADAFVRMEYVSTLKFFMGIWGDVELTEEEKDFLYNPDNH